MKTFLTAFIGAFSYSTTTSLAATVVFKNQCNHSIQVYDNHGTCEVASGTFQNPTFGCGRDIQGGATMYRHGTNPAATCKCVTTVILVVAFFYPDNNTATYSG
jgi:K+-transporting ATPase c subunit